MTDATDNKALHVGAHVAIWGLKGVVSGSEGTVRAVHPDGYIDVRLQNELVRVHQRYVRRVGAQPSAPVASKPSRKPKRTADNRLADALGMAPGEFARRLAGKGE